MCCARNHLITWVQLIDPILINYFSGLDEKIKDPQDKHLCPAATCIQNEQESLRTLSHQSCSYTVHVHVHVMSTLYCAAHVAV